MNGSPAEWLALVAGIAAAIGAVLSALAVFLASDGVQKLVDAAKHRDAMDVDLASVLSSVQTLTREVIELRATVDELRGVVDRQHERLSRISVLRADGVSLVERSRDGGP